MDNIARRRIKIAAVSNQKEIIEAFPERLRSVINLENKGLKKTLFLICYNKFDDKSRSQKKGREVKEIDRKV